MTNETDGWQRLRLHHRIAIPFTIVAVLMTAALAELAISLMQRTLESRVLTQVRNTALVVARADFALNPAILRTVREITGADVITSDADGTIVASTLDAHEGAALLQAAGGPAAIAQAAAQPPGEAIVERRTCGTVPCYVAVRRISARPAAVAMVVVRTNDVQVAGAAIARALIATAAVALVVMILASQTIARRVTLPIERLVAFTRAAEPGASRERAAVGPDEVGRLAAAFNDMLDRLERAQEAIVNSEKLAVTGLLAARVAHDIRNPLSSIKMQTQLLRAQARDDEARQLASAVLHDVDQVESVIRGLLELARPGELRIAAADLEDVIGQLLTRLAPQFSHRKVQVVTNFDKNVPPTPVDAARVEQAILNVVLNAADAMPYGGVLEVSTSLAPGGQAIVEIADDGVGIDPGISDRIFDPFVSTKRDGVGLGLVNTKAIVERHGGTITIAPRPTRGTVVRISLPLARPATAPAAS